MASRTRSFTSQFFIVAMLAFAATITATPAHAQMQAGWTWNMPFSMEQVEKNPVIVANAHVLTIDGEHRVGSYTDTSGEKFGVPVGAQLDIEGIPFGIDPGKVKKIGATLDFGRHWDFTDASRNWQLRVDTTKYERGKRHSIILGVEGPYGENRVKFFFFTITTPKDQKNFGLLQVMVYDTTEDPAYDPNDKFEVYNYCDGVTPAWPTSKNPEYLKVYRANKAALRAQAEQQQAQAEAVRLAEEARQAQIAADEARRKAQVAQGGTGTGIITAAPVALAPPVSSVPIGVNPSVWQRIQATQLRSIKPSEGRAIVTVSKPDGTPATTYMGKKTKLVVSYWEGASQQWQVLDQPVVPDNGVSDFVFPVGTKLRVKVRGASGPPLEAEITSGGPTYYFLEVK